MGRMRCRPHQLIPGIQRDADTRILRLNYRLIILIGIKELEHNIYEQFLSQPPTARLPQGSDEC